MLFSSWSLDGGRVTLEQVNGTNNTEYYIENVEWRLLVCSYRKSSNKPPPSIAFLRGHGVKEALKEGAYWSIYGIPFFSN